MTENDTDLIKFKLLQRGAWLSSQDVETPFSLTPLMLLIKNEYSAIQSETTLHPGCIHINVSRVRNNLVDLAARAWEAVAVLDSNRHSQAFQQVMDEARELYIRKNADYGDSYKSHGSVGVIVRLADKVQRARRLHQNLSHEVKSESLRDTLMDLGNYALMTVIVIDREK